MQVYGIRKCDRAEEAGGLRISKPLCKIKGDMLHMYLALDAEAVAGLERDLWAKVVRDAQSVCDLSAAFVELATHVRPGWVEAWFVALPQSADWLLPEEQAADVAGCATTDVHSRPADDVAGSAAGEGEEDSATKMRGRAACNFVGKWTMAQLALQVYGLDEALLYQVPGAVSTCDLSLLLSCSLHHAGMCPQTSCCLLLRTPATLTRRRVLFPHAIALAGRRWRNVMRGDWLCFLRRDENKKSYWSFTGASGQTRRGGGGGGEGGRLWHRAVRRTKAAD